MGGLGFGGESSRSTNPGNNKRRHSRSLSGSARAGPTTYFVRSEEEMVQGSSRSTAAPQLQDSTFGVRSLEDTLIDAERADALQHFGVGVDNRQPTDSRQQSSSPSRHAIFNLLLPEARGSSSASSIPLTPAPPLTARPVLRQTPTAILNMPFTPVYLASPGSESTPISSPRSGSLRSFHFSDEESVADDTGSQAIMSSGEEEEEEDDDDVAPRIAQMDAPQLVMPSISIPTRRAFTARGAGIGKLKILVAGPKGVGKSSLIQSIIRSCDDIVHVDSLSSSTLTSQTSRQEGDIDSLRADDQITEIFASTRAYPSWWSDMDESRVLRRRKSSSEPVLERNICFVDFPGHPEDCERNSGDRVVRYVEDLLYRNTSLTSLAESEILSIFSGGGGVQVDVVLYLCSDGPNRNTDLETMRRLSLITNVVPVVAKADLYNDTDLRETLTALSQDIGQASIRVFRLTPPSSDTDTSINTPADPFTDSPFILSVSSATSPDLDTLDASILMSPAYTPPLAPSDLPHLVARLFDPSTASHLRHASAKKFLYWRRTAALATPSAPTASSAHTLPRGGGGAHHDPASLATSTTTSDAVPSLANALVPASPPTLRLAHDPRHANRFAEARLARWAADLRQGLANERNRWAAEPAGWLVRRPGDAVSREERRAEEGRVADASAAADDDDEKARQGLLFAAPKTTSALDARDPLGLLGWDERVRSRAVLLAKVLGGCGVAGAVCLWVMRLWGVGAGGVAHAHGYGYGHGLGGGIWGGGGMGAGGWLWGPE